MDALIKSVGIPVDINARYYLYLETDEGDAPVPSLDDLDRAYAKIRDAVEKGLEEVQIFTLA